MSSASEDAGLVTPPIAQTPPRGGVVDMDQQSEDGDTCSVMSIDGDPLVAPSTPTPAGTGGGGRAGTPLGGATPTALMAPPSPVSREQLQKRIESLQQQNRVLKCELETYKLRVKSLQEENKAIRQASVHIVSMHLSLLVKTRLESRNFWKILGKDLNRNRKPFEII